jgi:hypothetical protein
VTGHEKHLCICGRRGRWCRCPDCDIVIDQRCHWCEGKIDEWIEFEELDPWTRKQLAECRKMTARFA